LSCARAFLLLKKGGDSLLRILGKIIEKNGGKINAKRKRQKVKMRIAE
jgi:hypothetical protein